jgi:hypothetical protein
LGKVVRRVVAAANKGAVSLQDALAVAPQATLSEQWVDIGGQMMPRGRLDELCRTVEEGRLTDLDALNRELDQIRAAYDEDEWAWVRWAYDRVFDTRLDETSGEDLLNLGEQLKATQGKNLKLVLHDAMKEFDAGIRTGFGQDGSDEDVASDFDAVRGTIETDKFVTQMNKEIASLDKLVEQFQQALRKVSNGGVGGAQ